MLKVGFLADVLATAMAVTSPSLAKDLGQFPSLDQSVTLVLSTPVDAAGKDSGLELNKLTSLVVKLIPKNPASGVRYTGLEFDARMPEHNHGMVVKPAVREIALDTFQIDGVKLHMAGNWQLLFTLETNGQPVKVTIPYKM